MGERHLAQSSLYKEEVYTAGHAAVWGSYYDGERQRWGYACCKGTIRGEPCVLADIDAVPADDEQDEDVAAAMRTWRDGRLLDDPSDAPSELPEARGEVTKEDYLASFVLHWFHDWVKVEKPDAKMLQKTKDAFLPLLQQLRRKEVPQGFLTELAAYAELAMQREYLKANDVYVGVTIGKALWHSHLDLGEQRAHWGQGCSLRTMQKQVVEKDHKNATLFDTDPVVQRYSWSEAARHTHPGCPAL
eukprot:TRINITY_DN52779_c0_g1_i1.p1 TRINITY_DN52779_c0_g1~~TRINITY_DN52779_c0_g1_i1.p1  ORF type:complete len:245 (-),score=60.62 TRINITY_DN52779_c0_g1_i1:855-1589(-)